MHAAEVSRPTSPWGRGFVEAVQALSRPPGLHVTHAVGCDRMPGVLLDHMVDVDFLRESVTVQCVACGGWQCYQRGVAVDRLRLQRQCNALRARSR